jgi:PIN domain nuclease of toxin-antitoxin system
MKYVIDTHALIWFLAGHPRLSPNADRVLNDRSSELVLPATALAEICWIVEHRAVGLTDSDVLGALDGDARFTVHPLDRAIIEKSNTLHSIREMHDRQITATTILLIQAGENASLITQDENITASGLVPVTW